MVTFALHDDPLTAARAHAERLRAEGWAVETHLFHADLPLPPQPRITRCDVRATRSGGDTRTLHTSFELAPNRGTGRMHWFAAPPPGGISGVALSSHQGPAC
jgi:hypothetical protein